MSVSRNIRSGLREPTNDNSHDPVNSRSIDLLVVVLMFASPITNLISFNIDGAKRIRGASGDLVWSRSGNLSGAVSLAIVIVLIAVALIVFLSAVVRKTDKVSAPSLALSLFAMCLAVMMFSRFGDRIQIYGTLGSAAVLGAIACRRPSATFVGTVGKSAGVLILLAGLYIVAFPSFSTSSCRADKCSPFGSLWNGYFPSENSLGIFICLLIPATAGLKAGTARAFLVLLGTVIVVGSGSRTSLLILLVALLGFVALRQSYTYFNDGRRRTLMRLIRCFPLVMFVASAVIYFTASRSDFTGRGAAYLVSRQALESTPLFGPGREIFRDAYLKGYTPGIQFLHEHGLAPYILTNAGYVGLAVMLAVLIWFATFAKSSYAIVMTAVLAFSFTTETVVEFNVRSPYFWAICVVTILECRAQLNSNVSSEDEVQSKISHSGSSVE